MLTQNLSNNLMKVGVKVVQAFKKVINPRNLVLIGTAILQLAGVIILGNLLKKLSYILIDRVLKQDGNKWGTRTNQRVKTLNNLLKSAVRYIIYFVGATMGLEILGIPTSSILAGAGVVGLAVGFGARSLVEDIITGFFILFEDQFGVGDYIATAGISGVVEELGLRITTIKDFEGDLHIIPNGQIKQVTNYTAANSRVLVDVGISYEENVSEVIAILSEYCMKLAKEIEDIEEGPEVLGVEKLADSSVVLRIVAWSSPMEEWQVARILRQKIKEKLNQENIEIPYPKRVIINANKEEE